MKNIHILPTDKPSKVWFDNDAKQFIYGINSVDGIYNCKNQNIYITSDEEINQQTNPCWCINTIKNTWNKDLIYYQGAMPQYHFVGFKKIILTTDQDLIKDGVQAIDDDFLEWFVNNSSCEEVNVVRTFIDTITGNPIRNWSDYKIIIPKEEPNDFGDIVNQEFFNLMDISKEEPKQTDEKGKPITYWGGLAEPKQETLEEAAERYASGRCTPPAIMYKGLMNAVKFGAKWQQEKDNKELAMWKLAIEKQEARCNALRNIISDLQERSYSEEEVLAMLLDCRSENPIDVNKWFEQSKKK